jgi:hypothetical protein
MHGYRRDIPLQAANKSPTARNTPPLLDALLSGKRRVRLRGGGISRHPHPSLSEEIAPHIESIEPVHVLGGVDAVQKDRGHGVNCEIMLCARH